MKRQEARLLRTQQGLSVSKIAAQLSVSKSSVSAWVKDIVLTSEQLRAMADDKARGAIQGGKTKSATHKRSRLKHQEEGRRKVREGNATPLHLAGCMLYWAEGSKERNGVGFSNSDPAMCVLFLRFLRECCGVKTSEIVLHCLCHANNDATVEDVERYWTKTLKLPQSCLRKTTVIGKVAKTDYRKNKIPYGVCKIRVFNTRLVQEIFGAIQEYGDFVQPAWVE